jgi:heme/copper-type cytochrome/quinol oxidase subunit 4
MSLAYSAMWLVLSFAVAIPRIVGVKDSIYQACAHLVMGTLFLAMCWSPYPRGWFFATIFTVLCVVEVVCARDLILNAIHTLG